VEATVAVAATLLYRTGTAATLPLLGKAYGDDASIGGGVGPFDGPLLCLRPGGRAAVGGFGDLGRVDVGQVESNRQRFPLGRRAAKAWARIRDRRQTEVALDKGRRLLESLPFPENVDHHFVVDPTKFDFYAMDCYRIVGEYKIAETLAGEVIHAYTDFDGQERAPTRLAEARITLGVVQAREGDLDGAIEHGMRALDSHRRSLPELLMVSRDLTKVLNEHYSAESKTRTYLDQVAALTALIPRQH
jgi:hypothetical protein